eukprot:TRINITY_DN79692_c0_g1_i1.p1 TRINITY_DN79692_c0_g1~~TRINITY_DN79692_c0_g1_i1.p1  ORF type:complete len:385 (-),score=167.45 TRINITY_DN79692_c0_g1_i1:274-1428(-)
MPMKRPAASKASAAQKRQKVEEDPVQLHVNSVCEGLLRSEDVPTAVLNMLSDMADAALRTCKDERHAYQKQVVDMMGTILSGVEASIDATVKDFQKKISESDAVREERKAVVKKAEDKVEGKKTVTHGCKHALADDARVFKETKAALSDAQVALQKLLKDQEGAVKHKERLDSTVADFVTPLANGNDLSAEDTSRLVESLLALVSKLGLDESMLTALPEAISKAPAARGPFDKSVVEGLQQELAKRVAAANEELAKAAPAKAEAESAVKAAEAAFEKSKEKQHGTAAAYNEARAAQKAAEDELVQAQQDLEALDPEVAKAKKDLTNSEKDLEAFESGPKNSFAELRDRVLPQEEAEAEEAEEAEAEAEAEEAADAVDAEPAAEE